MHVFVKSPLDGAVHSGYAPLTKFLNEIVIVCCQGTAYEVSTKRYSKVSAFTLLCWSYMYMYIVYVYFFR